MGEIDTLLQTVMFTLYGNQYENREEHLLLTMFQVLCPDLASNKDNVAHFQTTDRSHTISYTTSVLSRFCQPNLRPLPTSGHF